MKLNTLKDLTIAGHDVVREEAIKHILTALKKRKNLVKAWMYSMNITENDLANAMEKK